MRLAVLAPVFACLPLSWPRLPGHAEAFTVAVKPMIIAMAAISAITRVRFDLSSCGFISVALVSFVALLRNLFVKNSSAL